MTIAKWIGWIVVVGAAYVFVARAGFITVGLKRELTIERVLQDRAETLIGEGLQLYSTLAGGFQPFVGIRFSPSVKSRGRNMAARMSGDTDTAMEDLDGRHRETCF